MDINLLIQLISGLGFPIFCSCALGWYVFQTNKQNREDIKELNNKYSEGYKEFTSALNNNTIALNNLAERINDLDKKG